jgi:hypothetical protein
MPSTVPNRPSSGEVWATKSSPRRYFLQAVQLLLGDADHVLAHQRQVLAPVGHAAHGMADDARQRRGIVRHQGIGLLAAAREPQVDGPARPLVAPDAAPGELPQLVEGERGGDDRQHAEDQDDRAAELPRDVDQLLYSVHFQVRNDRSHRP